MADRTITVAPYMLPGGGASRVYVTFTLVDTNGDPVAGYRSEDNQGIIGKQTLQIQGATQTIELTPTTEITPESYWHVSVVLPGVSSNSSTVQLGDGASLTLPELLALGPAPGYWDIVDNRLLPNPSGGTNGSIPVILDDEWIIADAPAGSGTVTSVAISGTDGLEVDSGSPVTSSGTLVLGVNIAAMRSHLGLGTAAYTATSDYVAASWASSHAADGNPHPNAPPGLNVVSFPVAADAPGNVGDIAFSSNFIAICLATDTWYFFPASSARPPV